MRLAKKFSIPQKLALLYEFLNSADLRTYVEQGEQHVPSDELETPAQSERWMRERGLLKRRESITAADHRLALELRSALRSYVQLAPDSRDGAGKPAEDLNRIAELFVLVVKIGQRGEVELQPAQGATGLARVLAELFSLADSNCLGRLKMCSSDECHWIFFDRSKPGNRRWCSSLKCGNRQKTRDYRKRTKAHLRKALN
jgi:predicted RNA-binding Zn ribbon-like protein